MKELSVLRKDINSIDEKITLLFEERMHLVKEILKYKKQHNLAIFDETRENEVLKNTLVYLKDSTLEKYHQDFFKSLMNISKAYQTTILNQENVGFQGQLGAFSHLTAKKLFPYHHLQDYLTFQDVFKAVNEDKISFGVIPLENSYYGEVGDILDLLMQNKLQIIATYDLKVSHHLIGLKDSNLNEIKKIYSHPQAISQCSKFLKGLNAEIISYPNTALAVAHVKKLNDKSLAAIAALETAEIYQLETLANNIHDYDDNFTRFIVISKHQNNTGKYASLLFTTKHQSGALNEILSIISNYGFNLESIKSRPYHLKAWSYYFYIELDINHKIDKYHNLIKELETTEGLVKDLGVYNRQKNEIPLNLTFY